MAKPPTQASGWWDSKDTPGRPGAGQPESRGPQKPSKRVLIAIFAVAFAGLPMLIGGTYFLSSRFLTTAPPTPPPPPGDLCMAIGKARIAELVRDPVISPDRTAYGNQVIVGCSAETASGASATGYDALDVQLDRPGPIGSMTAEEVAADNIDKPCKDLMARDIAPNSVRVPIPGLDSLGDRRCGLATYARSEKAGTQDIYAVRGPDVLHIRYDPSQTDDTTPQRLLVALARHILTKTDPARQ